MRTLLKKVLAGTAATGAIVGGSFLIGDTYFNDGEFSSPDNSESYQYFDPLLRAIPHRVTAQLTFTSILPRCVGS